MPRTAENDVDKIVPHAARAQAALRDSRYGNAASATTSEATAFQREA